MMFSGTLPDPFTTGLRPCGIPVRAGIVVVRQTKWLKLRHGMDAPEVVGGRVGCVGEHKRTNLVNRISAFYSRTMVIVRLALNFP